MSINALKVSRLELVLKQHIDREVKFMMKFCGMRSMGIHENNNAGGLEGGMTTECHCCARCDETDTYTL